MRETTIKLLELAKEGVISWESIARICLCYLSEDEVADIYEWVQEQIGLENVEAFCDIIRPFQTHANHKDATELYPLAKEWAKIVRDTAKERGDEDSKEGNSMAKDFLKAILDALSPEIGFVPKKKFSKDMLVRIVEGPFSEFTGKIETVYEEKEILKVMISLFGRDTPIEIEYSQVEKI